MNNSKYKSYMDRITNEFSNHTYTCKCGHRIVITAQKEKKLCINWCLCKRKVEILFGLLYCIILLLYVDKYFL